MERSAPVPRIDDFDALSTLAPTVSVPAQISRFPATRYYGSKRKLLGWMHAHFCTIPFDSALDAFGGTASVSLLFKLMGKAVTYHDGLTFNENVGRAVLAERPALDRQSVEGFLAAVKPSSGVISKHFRGLFFKASENAWLDGFAMKARGLPESDRDLLHYLVYQACLKKRPFNLFHRANLHLRTNKTVARTFGNAVTWERSFLHHSMQAYDDLCRLQVQSAARSIILSSGDASRISPGYDLVYIDPPYVSREERYNRDNYWRRYNFLEGLSRYDEWSDLIDENSDIRMFPAPTWFEDWNSTKTFTDRLFSLIDRHKNSIVVLSYVSGAVPSGRVISNEFRSKFSKVMLRYADHNHALSKTRKREFLFVGYPR